MPKRETAVDSIASRVNAVVASPPRKRGEPIWTERISPELLRSLEQLRGEFQSPGEYWANGTRKPSANDLSRRLVAEFHGEILIKQETLRKWLAGRT